MGIDSVNFLIEVNLKNCHWNNVFIVRYKVSNTFVFSHLWNQPLAFTNTEFEQRLLSFR